MTKNPVEPVEAERTMADLYPAEPPKPEPVKVHPMAEDFRLPKKRRSKSNDPFDKLTADEFDRERLRQIRREDSWMGRGRGY